MGINYSWAESKLKPCPFCSCKVRFLPQEYGFSVDCTSFCNVTMKSFTKLQRQAIHEWNTKVNKVTSGAKHVAFIKKVYMDQLALGESQGDAEYLRIARELLGL